MWPATKGVVGLVQTLGQTLNVVAFIAKHFSVGDFVHVVASWKDNNLAYIANGKTNNISS